MSEQTFVMGLVGGTLAAAFMNIVPAITVICILIICDLAFALWACAKTGEKIESNKLRKTCTKTLAYLSLIILGSMIDVAIADHFHLAVFIGGFCSITELVSIIESLSRITDKDYLGKLRDILQDKLNKDVKPRP